MQPHLFAFRGSPRDLMVTAVAPSRRNSPLTAAWRFHSASVTGLGLRVRRREICHCLNALRRSSLHTAFTLSLSSLSRSQGRGRTRSSLKSFSKVHAAEPTHDESDASARPHSQKIMAALNVSCMSAQCKETPPQPVELKLVVCPFLCMFPFLIFGPCLSMMFSAHLRGTRAAALMMVGNQYGGGGGGEGPARDQRAGEWQNTSTLSSVTAGFLLVINTSSGCRHVTPYVATRKIVWWIRQNRNYGKS